jgi:lipopolysaccharide/colanic/teichoic acid biosynthesis glycosyltransferase
MNNIYRNYLKFFIDFLVSLCSFIILIPVFLVVMVVLTVANRGNPFFFQRRPGKNGRIFLLMKFRTMSNAKDANGKLLPDELRLTSFGKFVRKTSLDEIPQLLNVIKGDMSLIGPRPLLVEYLPLYNETEKRRHDVRPGITGWAQVNGRNAISWGKRFELDIYYVDHISFKLDMLIVFMTLKKLVKPEGISQQGHVTMPVFEGKRS